MGLREQTRQRVAEHTPAACLLLVAMALLSGVSEVTTFAGRGVPVIVLSLFCTAAAAAMYAWVRTRPESIVPAMLVAVNAVSLAIVAYHAYTGASAEGCLLVLTALLCSATVFCHWGWRFQFLASLGAAISFPIALYTRLDPALAPLTLVLFLGCVMGLSAYGAHVIESGLVRVLHAKELAERAYRMKGEFLATMSHELRTPMNVIFGMTEMALEMDSATEQRECIRTTRRAAESLLVLMDEVLDLSRIEAGRLELHPQPFSIRAWLADSIEPLRTFARSKNLRLDWEVSPDVQDQATGDPNRLRQVLINLVGNALKFTDAGEVRVRVEPEIPADSESRLHFMVSDTGVGISETERDRIFDAYVQADAHDGETRGGTGLGLAICSRLVDLMGGRIWVESDLGKGSCFHFIAARSANGHSASLPGST